MKTGHELVIHRISGRSRRVRWISGIGLVLALLLLTCALTVGGIRQANANTLSTSGVATPSVVGDGNTPPEPGGGPPTTPSAEIGSGPAGWEMDALRDLAEVQEWPPVVSRDANGRMTVQQVISSTQWSLAMIRSFDYHPGASAAFAAEQEDARISGYQVTSEFYYTYPSYWAVLTDSTGRPLEMRFHWLAGKWIMGVDIGLPGVRTSDVRTVSQRLLALSLQYGLPTPTPGSSTTPTTVLGPPTATLTPVSCGTTFTDVQSDYWAQGFIGQLACDGVVSGYSDGSFRPQNPTTRAQLAKMVVLSENWTLVSPSRPTFVDVGLGHIFYRYVETAHVHGIISGYNDGTFQPDDYVTRAQVAKMVVRARNWPLRVSSPVALCDVGIGHWARDFIQVAIERGIFTGYGDGCFRPDAQATRAQLAKVIVLAGR